MSRDLDISRLLIYINLINIVRCVKIEILKRIKIFLKTLFS